MMISTYHCDTCGNDYSFPEDADKKHLCPECRKPLRVKGIEQVASLKGEWYVRSHRGRGAAESEGFPGTSLLWSPLALAVKTS